MKFKVIYSLLSIGLASGALMGVGNMVNADTENESSEFKNKANEIFDSENSKVELVIDENGE